MTLLQVEIGVVIGLSIGIFLLITLLLVWVLIFARTKLMPQGKVKITINDEKELETDPGSTLLSTLSSFHLHVEVEVHVACVKFK
mgnify:CR=1 FL=1